MAHIFQFRGKTYSVSDKNDKNEYVVVKMGKNNKIEAAKVITAGSEPQVEKLIKLRNFDNFKTLEGFTSK